MLRLPSHLHLTLRKCCACHEIRSSPSEPANKSASRQRCFALRWNTPNTHRALTLSTLYPLSAAPVAQSEPPLLPLSLSFLFSSLLLPISFIVFFFSMTAFSSLLLCSLLLPFSSTTASLHLAPVLREFLLSFLGIQNPLVGLVGLVG